MSISDDESEIVKPGMLRAVAWMVFYWSSSHSTGFVDRLYHLGSD